MDLLAGSTGFLGNEILKILGIKEIPTIALGRRSVPNLPDSAQELIIDFNHLKKINFPNIDHVYLSLGYPLYFQNVMGFMSSTLKKKFFEVDFIYQLEIAKKAKEMGVKSISLISAVGADPNSWNYYLKTKGMLEEEIIKLEFSSINIFRPGHLMGNKKRLDIVLADLISLIFDPFLHGQLKKFRSISAKKLSKSVVSRSMDCKAGIHIYEFKDFRNF
jgi:Predicted nucleoside-diphosphate-sugar epimerases